MRRTGFIIAVGLLAATLVSPAFAAGDDPASSPPIFCGNGIPGGVNCIASKKELKEARYAFDRGVKLKDHRRLEEAFTQFDTATRLAPQNIQFLTARERVRHNWSSTISSGEMCCCWKTRVPRLRLNFGRLSISMGKTSLPGSDWRKRAVNWLPRCPELYPLVWPIPAKFTSNPKMTGPLSITAVTFTACSPNCPRLME